MATKSFALDQNFFSAKATHKKDIDPSGFGAPAHPMPAHYYRDEALLNDSFFQNDVRIAAQYRKCIAKRPLNTIDPSRTLSRAALEAIAYIEHKTISEPVARA
ncbi:MAG: hypothetical protein AAF603_09470 [Pseudomonadota bacterium]